MTSRRCRVMMNRHGLRRGMLYHAPETIPAWGNSPLGPLRRNSASLSHESALQRRRVTVQGIVQGAGFRSFVSTLARRWELSGHVLNDSTGVIIEVQGLEPSIESFLDALLTNVPPLSHIDAINTEIVPVSSEESSFVVVQNQADIERSASIPPDIAICDDCLHELFDPKNRRYHYPFISCASCGPRFSIFQGIPVDRKHSTMNAFPMCKACQAEYDTSNQASRRYHAQANCCPNCGPQMRFLDKAGQVISDIDPVTAAAQHLAAGAVLAIKGLGGYQLVCDALNEEAVRHLRQCKQSEEKPLALMVPDIETAQQFCTMDEAEIELLQSTRRPTVSLKRREDNPDCTVASGVAPAHCTFGIMLPYTPLHHLLLHAYRHTSDPGHPIVLVMTSGNLNDEPAVYHDDDALTHLLPIVDGILLHNRAIHIRCDESVVRSIAGGEQLLRRSRGYVPDPISLPWEFPVPLLACGGYLKNTFCLGKEKQAFLSHHIGDIENLETLLSFREGIEHFQQLFDILPEAVAYDLHPDYLASQYALDMDLPHKIGVQHHHAHIASVLAEYGLAEPVIGVAADGSGYGTDGAVWGCEVMIADLTKFERVAHLAYIPLPGGAQALRQPWRMAAVYLARAYGDDFSAINIPFTDQLEHSTWRTLSRMVVRNLNSSQTSSLGRLFDAVAALLGLCSHIVYEGQTTIELEMLATTCTDPVVSYPYTIGGGRPAQLDVVPLIKAIVNDIEQGTPREQIARRFHLSIADMLANACAEVRTQSGLQIVALSGGVFQNRLLLEELVALLKKMSFQVYINRRVPPNDGGISLGQAAIAAAQLR